MKRLLLPSTGRPIARDAVIAGLLFISMTAIGFVTLRQFRAAGFRPDFYQANFEPAVLLACGRGFGVTVPTPPAITAFLALRADRFDCRTIPADALVRPLTSAAHANWYYMYGSAAAIWRVTGVSWPALDGLVALLAGATATALYALFRIVAGRPLALAGTLLLALSPPNLTHLLSLRDYSKAPFVLIAIAILAVLLLRPLSLASRLALTMTYGVLVGIGYGFRADLIVMVPFGVAMVMLFVPRGGGVRPLVENAGAGAALLAAFLVTASPILGGMKYGGCQYHFALLGLTTPLAAEMRLTPARYRFGDHLTDTFVDLKTGDYATRIVGGAVPGLCTADYDRASGDLYFQFARTFPADLVARAYASVLMVQRVGLLVPAMMQPAAPLSADGQPLAVYRLLEWVTSIVAPAGPIVALAGMATAFMHSLRLGLALTLAILFLTGYPAVQFEERHWFHLRFIPWWCGALVITAWWNVRGRLEWRIIRPGVVAVAVVLGALVVALSAIRAIQGTQVRGLVSRYLAEGTERVAFGPAAGIVCPSRREPHDYGTQPNHRGSDLLVVDFGGGQCDGLSPAIRVVYDADAPSRDLSTQIQLAAIGATPTRLFLPIFWQGLEDHVYLRFRGLTIDGAPPSCIARLARVRNRAALPMWLQVEVHANWSDGPLYETMRPPRLFNR